MDPLGEGPAGDDASGWSTAGIRDCWLGGTDHTRADRRVADQILVGAPQLPYVVRTYRAFLRRAVTHLVEAGIRQFLDLGSGNPAAGNVHEVAQQLAPDCRVAYVDIDQDVVRQGGDLIAGQDRVHILNEDLRRPDQVLNAARRASALDLTAPLAVLIIDVLHLIPDSDRPDAFIKHYAGALPSGSYLCLTQATDDKTLVSGLETFHNFYRLPVPPLSFREPAQVEEFLSPLEVVEPGVCPVPLWRPEVPDDPGANPEHFPGYAALARKP